MARHRLVVVHDVGTPTRTWRLRNPNAVGAALLFLVVGQSGGRWAVRVPARPNGSVGWVRGSDVRVELDPYSLRVSLTRHRLTVFRYGRPIRRYPVGVGRPSAPTPTGHYYLTELLRPRATGTPYGPYAYGTSAFSDVYSEFEGGPGQIGVHGTSDPSSIGRDVSHGCVRLHNADMAKLATIVPAGTPVTIST